MRRGAWIATGLAVMAATGGITWWRVGRSGDKAPTYRTEAVQQGDVKLQVSATGTLQAVTTVLVGSQVSGTIASLYADFNDPVRKGQVLAQLDPTFLNAQMAESRANLDRVAVQLRQAERDSVRAFALGEQGLISGVDLDVAQTAVETARAQMASTQAALERAATNLRYATVYSPIDGVVVSRDVDVGQTVAASLSAPTIFTIAEDLTRMQLQASVDEADIGAIREGLRASFTVDAHPGSTFHGEVHQVRLLPLTVQNVVTYTVIIRVENAERKLLPGMTANVTILIDEAKDVMRVPVAALRFKPETDGPGAGGRPGGPEGARGAIAATGPAAPNRERGPGMRGPGEGQPAADRGRVFVLENEKPRPVRVRTGLTDGTYTAVFSDSLKVGDPVIVGLNLTGAAASAQQGTVNPFAPQMGGGGRRGR